MGLTNSTDQGQKTFLNVVGGKFARQMPEGTEGTVSRENKNGKTVHELLYNQLQNVTIVSIDKKISDNFGASWEVVLKEADEQFVLNLPYSGRITNGLLFRLPNIDFSQPVTLKLFTNDESKTFMTAYDKAGNKIETAYSKENPNGLPQLEKIKLKGVETWDDTKQMEFIETMIERDIQTKLLASKMTPSEPLTTDNQEDISDLPF